MFPTPCAHSVASAVPASASLDSELFERLHGGTTCNRYCNKRQVVCRKVAMSAWRCRAQDAASWHDACTSRIAGPRPGQTGSMRCRPVRIIRRTKFPSSRRSRARTAAGAPASNLRPTRRWQQTSSAACPNRTRLGHTRLSKSRRSSRTSTLRKPSPKANRTPTRTHDAVRRVRAKRLAEASAQHGVQLFRLRIPSRMRSAAVTRSIGVE